MRPSDFGKVTLGRLRKEAPSWTWRSERSGFGSYQYVGTRREATVLVVPRAILADEDEFATRWIVEGQGCSQSYDTWLLHDRSRPVTPEDLKYRSAEVFERTKTEGSVVVVDADGKPRLILSASGD